MGMTEVFGNCPKCGLEWHAFGVTPHRRERMSVYDYLYANPHVLGIECPCGHRLPREKAMSGSW